MDQTSPDQTTANKASARKLSPGLKFTLEMGPLFLFMLANFRPKIFEPALRLIFPPHLFEGDHAGLFTATAVVMIATVVALIVSFAITRRLPIMPLVTAIIILIFGGLTLYLRDQSFFQMKPTIIYAACGSALLIGMAFNRPLLPIILDQTMKLTEQGWRILTLRWGICFLVFAVLNEIVRRTMTWDHWVLFKFPGTVILMAIFTFAQVPLIMRHELKSDAADPAPEHI